MGRWLAKFLPERAGSRTDIPDTLTSVSGLSGGHPSLSVRLEPEIKDFFQERAAIREYDGEQGRVEAELGALEEVFPTIRENGELHLPFNVPDKYKWWAGGQSLEVTLRELGASDETIRRYVFKMPGGIPKPEGAE